MIAVEEKIPNPLQIRNRHVIVAVDDQEEVLGALRRVLRTEPYELKTTTSPPEALRWIREGDVSVFISDERMPDMRGTDLLEEVQRRRPEATRVMLTGYPGSATITCGLNRGIDWLISKPWNDEALRLTLRQLVRRREAGRKAVPWLEEFLDQVPVPIQALDAEGTLLWANRPMIDLVGYGVAEMTGRPFSDLLEAPAAFRPFLDRLVREEPLREYPLTLRCRDGSARHVLVDSSFPHRDGEPASTLVFLRDVTAQTQAEQALQKYRETLERRVEERTEALTRANGELQLGIAERARAEAALRETRDRIGLLLDSTAEAICGFDVEGRCMFLNASCLRMLGYDRAEELLGRDVHGFLHPAGACPGGECRVARSLRERKAVHLPDEQVGRPGGATIRADFWCHPVPPEGRPLGGVATIVDITERKAAEQERDRLAIQLLHGQKIQALGQLSAGIAHEINNPIGYIISNLATLQEYLRDLASLLRITGEACDRLLAGEDPAESRTALERIRKAVDAEMVLGDFRDALDDCHKGGERIRDIVRSLREFSHVDEGKLMASDLNALLEDALRLCWNELKYKAEVTKSYGEVPPLPCYPQQVTQVIVNLLVNAADAIPDKGRITLSTEVDRGAAVIRVRDTGQGIPAVHRDRLFEPFFTTKPVGKGTGLGLHTAYKIVHAHGGTIEVDSREGEGTEFSVRLPLGGPPERKT